mgnify:CR=1 FL=1
MDEKQNRKDFFLTPERMAELGVWQYGSVPTDKIPFSEAARKMCEDNVCRSYGTSWACPPAVGTVAECRERCLAYTDLLVFSGCYPLEDSFDYEGMVAAAGEFKNTCGRLYEEVKKTVSDFLLLSNGKCSRCSACTYPDAPCRFPEQLYPALEGYGVLVSELAAKAKINYINGANTVTYIGGILWNSNG